MNNIIWDSDYNPKKPKKPKIPNPGFEIPQKDKKNQITPYSTDIRTDNQVI